MKANKTNKANQTMQVDIREAKTFAQTLLNLNRNQFDLEYIKSEKIKQTIGKIINREAAKESQKKGMAFVIQLWEYSKFPKLKADTNCDRVEAWQTLIKRRAMSPNIK